MSQNNDLIIPNYAIHNEKEVKGFFGPKYRFLSNFYPCKVIFEGINYPNSECAYQAQKVDLKFRSHFIYITAGQSKYKWKELGSIYNEEQWNSVKLNLMKAIVFIKFYKNLDLRQKLLDTNDRYLEETNNWKDSFFGVNCNTGVGRNELGKILMNIRHFWK